MFVGSRLRLSRFWVRNLSLRFGRDDGLWVDLELAWYGGSKVQYTLCSRKHRVLSDGLQAPIIEHRLTSNPPLVTHQ